MRCRKNLDRVDSDTNLRFLSSFPPTVSSIDVDGSDVVACMYNYSNRIQRLQGAPTEMHRLRPTVSGVMDNLLLLTHLAGLGCPISAQPTLHWQGPG